MELLLENRKVKLKRFVSIIDCVCIDMRNVLYLVCFAHKIYLHIDRNLYLVVYYMKTININ